MRIDAHIAWLPCAAGPSDSPKTAPSVVSADTVLAPFMIDRIDAAGSALAISAASRGRALTLRADRIRPQVAVEPNTTEEIATPGVVRPLL